MLIAFLIIFGLIKLPKGGLLLFLYLGATMAVLLVWPEQYLSLIHISLYENRTIMAKFINPFTDVGFKIIFG